MRKELPENMKLENQQTSNENEEKMIYFCPECHNIRVKVGSYTNYICNRCDSFMTPVIKKTDYDVKTGEQKKQIINNLKATCQEVATPTEILLKKLIANTRQMNENLNSIKNMITFFFVLTIIGIIIMFLSMS